MEDDTLTQGRKWCGSFKNRVEEKIKYVEGKDAKFKIVLLTHENNEGSQ